MNYTKDITLFSNGKKLLFDKSLLEKRGIKFDNSKIEKILGEKKVSAIKTINGEIHCEGIFIASGNADSNDLAKMLGLDSKNGKLIVDESMRTSIPGIFAAGDCTPGIGQISTAVAKGAIAGITISKEV